MDPLSLSTGVGGLLGLTLQLVKSTHQYISCSAKASKNIGDFLNEARSLCEVLRRLDSVVSQNE